MGYTAKMVFLLFAALYATLASAQMYRHGKSFKPDYVLVGTAKNITVDCQSRYSVILNGTSPGPPLYMQENRTTWIRVYNNIKNQNLTVHWHGLSQRTAIFSDGTPQLAQWPIPPMNYFDYELRPDVGDAGTYFYHSHVGFQAISAQGPLIVKERHAPPYKYKDDIILLLSDFYKKNDSTIEKGLLADPFVWSGESNALLVNGHSGTSGFNNATDKSCSPYKIKVKPGTTYRMRFIGGTAISLITLGIEAHDNLTIIEADGGYTKPATTDHLQIASGQRFSLLFKTKTKEELAAANKTNFWIRYENRERPANISGYALLSYDLGHNTPNTSALAIPAKSPVTLPQKVYDWLEYTLQPINNSANPFPYKSTRTVTITVRQVGNINATGGFISPLQWAQNGDIWQETAREKQGKTPYLVDIYKRGQAAIPDLQKAIANGGWDPDTLTFPAKIGEIVDIVWESNNLPTGGWDIHPFHAHGGHYWDLGSGNGTYNATANDAKIAAMKYTPAIRDTTMLYRYATSGVKGTTAGWRAWRLKVDDAGVWMIHCHILQHMIMGMQTVWIMGDAADIAGKWPEPFVAGYLDYGGSAYGNATYDPFVGHYFPGNSGGMGSGSGTSGGY